MTEAEFIAGCKRNNDDDDAQEAVPPTTVTVLAENGFTVLHESIHSIVSKGYSVSPEELHVYDEDIGTMKQMAEAINQNSDTTVVLSRSRKQRTHQRTYVTPSLIVNKKNNIHCLRGHLSNEHMITDETGGD
jgi:hypothetical protein